MPARKKEYEAAERIHAYGRTWIRYPQTKNSDRWRYAARINMHTYVWEVSNGQFVPPGWVVHHIDGNSTNNAPDNLMAMPKGEHARGHGALLSDERRTQMRQQAESVRDRARAWHQSAEGKAWHSAHGRETWVGRQPIEKECALCGTGFQTLVAHGRFCSDKCRAAARRRSKIDDVVRICPMCSLPFTRDRYVRTLYCSRKCASQARTGSTKIPFRCKECGTEGQCYRKRPRQFCGRACRDAYQRHFHLLAESISASV